MGVGEVAFAAGRGELDLFLSLGEAALAAVRGHIETRGACHADRIPWIGAVLWCDDGVAVRALIVVAGYETVTHRHTAVEDVTLAVPGRLVLGDCLEILENPALELVHVLETLILHPGCQLFAPNATGTEHGNGWFVGKLRSVRYPIREVAKDVDLGVDGPLECADGELVVVAGVDHDDVRIGYQVVPFRWCDVGPGAVDRVDVTHTESHDLLLETDLEAKERGVLGVGELCFDRGETRFTADECKYVLDAGRWTGDGPVEPFTRQQDRPEDIVVGTHPVEGLPEIRKLGEVRKLVKRCNEKHRSPGDGRRTAVLVGHSAGRYGSACAGRLVPRNTRRQQLAGGGDAAPTGRVAVGIGSHGVPGF